MTEAALRPEAQELLPKAVKHVSRMYRGDQLWRETAQEYGPFSEKITSLREVIKTSDVTKRIYPEPVAKTMRGHFLEVEDGAAKELLTDVLFTRTTTTPGCMDYGMEPVEEAEAMVTELGAGEVLSIEQLKRVSLGMVVEKILRGDLKLTLQTQL